MLLQCQSRNKFSVSNKDVHLLTNVVRRTYVSNYHSHIIATFYVFYSSLSLAATLRVIISIAILQGYQYGRNHGTCITKVVITSSGESPTCVGQQRISRSLVIS